jgi:Leucine-rich repeat (LRR) protein
MNDSLESISQIKSLKDLKMADCMLTGELSTSIASLVELEILEVQGNKLSSLPDEMNALVRLKTLNVSNNQLSALPMAELSTLPLVQILASKNSLSGALFSDAKASMDRLQDLDVSVNSLSSLCHGSLSLPSLQILNIAFNRITSLPEMSTWTSVSTILAEDNKISDIPDGFTSIDTLRSVDFTGNDLKKLDPSIGVMKGLESFVVAANPIRERKFLTMGTTELKRDLRARLGVDALGDGDLD